MFVQSGLSVDFRGNDKKKKGTASLSRAMPVCFDLFQSQYNEYIAFLFSVFSFSDNYTQNGLPESVIPRRYGESGLPVSGTC
jgi:hypothetical protein